MKIRRRCTGATMATIARVLNVLRALVAVGMVQGASVGADSTNEIVCEENEENRWAQLTPLGDTSQFNISNVSFAGRSEHQVVVDVVLYSDRTELMLPNGMMVRVVTAKYQEKEFDLSFDGLMDVQQSIWEIVIGNLLGTFICCAMMGLFMYLEQKYQCIGSEKIHSMMDKQHQLHDDLDIATGFLNNMQKDPRQLHGPAAAMAFAFQAATGAASLSDSLQNGMDEVRISVLLLFDCLLISRLCDPDTGRGSHRRGNTQTHTKAATSSAARG